MQQDTPAPQANTLPPAASERKATRVLTFTANPLAETTALYGTWKPGATQRALSESFQVGGKGVNVAKMLQRLGTEVVAATFLGGASGQECSAWLARQPFAHIALPCASATRRGLVVRASGLAETTFLGADAIPDADAWRAAAALISSQPPHTTLALCGSVPGWSSPEAQPFREALDVWLRAGRPFHADTYGPPLAWCAARPTTLIKINAQECAALVGAPAVDALAEAARRWPAVRAWIVTDGPRPARLLEPGHAVVEAAPPPVAEVSATGSGDVLLAALLHARYLLGLDWKSALHFALPLATANAAHPGIAAFPLPRREAVSP